mgnify:CR=1 FL=1
MDNLATVRVDRWLWAARFFKTRPDAVTALRAGHVLVNNRRSRPAKALRIGDRICLRRGLYTSTLTVLQLPEKRISPAGARETYVEDASSIEKRHALAAELRAQPIPRPAPRGRPGKRERRILGRLRRGQE